MKCRRCGTTMKKKSTDKSNYYFECPKCHATIGKTTEVAEIEAKKEEMENESSTESEVL